MKPYITLEEALAAKEPNKRAYSLLGEENGCTNGCCCGITIYDNDEFPEQYGAHADQEGFYVLEGCGVAKLDELEFPIKPGDAFVALPGVRHTVKKTGNTPVKVLWFHAAK